MSSRSKLTVRRLVGLDRSGPPPPQTTAGQPLNPWTIPNAIGFVRLVLIPVFVIVAYREHDGHHGTAAVIFAIIAWGDYADGITARITGQYSRLGALLDPIVDRLLVISGFVVAWHFQLLPHWGIALLVAREAFMLVAGRLAIQRGVALQINWPGRLGVFPVMSSAFFALTGPHVLAVVLLYIGLFFALWATTLYIVDARRQLAAGASSASPSSSH